MTKTSVRVTAAVLVASLGLALFAPAASAAPPHPGDFAERKAECLRKIDWRIIALLGTKAKINASERLTDDQKSSMSADIMETVGELDGPYRHAVITAHTWPMLNEACSAIFVELRIWAVFLPQVIFTGYLDAIGNWSEHWQGEIDDAAAGGADVTEAQAFIDSAESQLDEAAELIASVTSELFNEDPEAVKAAWHEVKGAQVFDTDLPIGHQHQIRRRSQNENSRRTRSCGCARSRGGLRNHCWGRGRR
jgi:hypothetical protein